ncbi:hypothetical protein KUV26_10930 [Leisingera daeponensis]|uniref:Uncharacterized protein n=1 Tax=Leisingera daeponensis TaxID=405746 RepID=A0ABS7NFG1_9RHOB|nr:hypothetical protein [Leisingera daeponensis]MBY6056331.1 hypothetical protein [Leisingera daeponensis]MBY6139951.1 hypothetical protein [Leisingera daeponensis]
MPNYNDMFELSVEDMDLIETALRHTRDSLSKTQPETGSGDAETLRRVHALLGRLHNQKIFYYPKDKVYVSG